MHGCQPSHPTLPDHTAREAPVSGLLEPCVSSFLVVWCPGALPDRLYAVGTHAGRAAPFCVVCLPTFPFFSLGTSVLSLILRQPHPWPSTFLPLSSSVSLSPLLLLQLADSVWVGCGEEAPEPRLHLLSPMDPREGGRQRR